VQDTFTHLPDRLAEYAELSGHPIDVRRVWYYRLFAETTMATMSPAEEEEGERTKGDVGNLLMYQQLHRRLWLETLNELMGLGLARPAPLANPEDQDWHGVYDEVLDRLKTITPRIADPLAATWTKGVARAIRYLQRVDDHGRDAAALEKADIADALGHAPASLAAGRDELIAANQRGQVSDERYVAYLWNKVMRNDDLMAGASGALRTRGWPPLT